MLSHVSVRDNTKSILLEYIRCVKRLHFNSDVRMTLVVMHHHWHPSVLSDYGYSTHRVDRWASSGVDEQSDT